MIQSAVYCKVKHITPVDHASVLSTNLIARPLLYSIELSTVVDPSRINDTVSPFVDIGVVVEVVEDTGTKYGVVPSDAINNVIRRIIELADVATLVTDVTSDVLRVRPLNQDNIWLQQRE